MPALERWRRLPAETPRDEYFEVLRAAVTEYYLADPSNPYQQSGRSTGAERWRETKRGLVKVLGRGEIDKALTVKAHAFSATAKAKIEAAGGTTETLR